MRKALSGTPGPRSSRSGRLPRLSGGRPTAITIVRALVERYRTPQQIPKGQNLTNRTLEHFYFWGCVDELRAARVMPPGYPIGGVTAYGNLMSDYWYANAGQSGRGEAVRKFYFQ